MFKIKSLLEMNLHLFDGEGGGPAGGEAAPAAQADPVPASVGKKRTGEKSVMYGVQDAPTGTDQTGQPATDAQPASIDRKGEFEKLVMGDYKDLFQEKVQGIIDKRFKETKTLEKQLGDTKPILDVLMNKYGVEDVTGLQKAIEADDAYWEELADKEGLTVDQYKLKQRLESENAMLRQQQQQVEAQKRTQEIYQGWLQQSESIKAVYPDFNLDAEVANPQFIEMISRGVDLKAAYEVLHMNDILGNVAKKVESNVANTIRANGQRPSENGTSSSSGVIVKSDVSKLSRADREEVARRVARGETIKF